MVKKELSEEGCIIKHQLQLSPHSTSAVPMPNTPLPHSFSYPAYSFSERAWVEHQRVFSPYRFQPYEIFRSGRGHGQGRGRGSLVVGGRASCQESHNFFCLAKRSKRSVPTTLEKPALMGAGLGEARIQFNLAGSTSDFHFTPLRHYARIRNSGGYELCTCIANSKTLVASPAPHSGYTAEHVRGRVRQSRVYVCPLQNDISLEPVDTCEGGIQVRHLSIVTHATNL